MGKKFSMRNLDSLEARQRQYLYIKKKFPELSGKAQSQVLGNCLYLGQKVLREADPAVIKETMRHVKALFNEVYKDQPVQENKGQRIWYWGAKWNLKFCCLIRNQLRIGL